MLIFNVLNTIKETGKQNPWMDSDYIVWGYYGMC